MRRIGYRIDERKAAGGKRGPARTEVSREPYFAAFNQVDRVVLKVQLPEQPVSAAKRAATLRKHQDAIIASIDHEHVSARESPSGGSTHQKGGEARLRPSQRRRRRSGQVL